MKLSEPLTFAVGVYLMVLSLSTCARPLSGCVRTETIRLAFSVSGSVSLASTSILTDWSSSVVAVSLTAVGASFTLETLMVTVMLSDAVRAVVAVTVAS